MPPHFHDLGHALEWRSRGETLRVEAGGPDSVRVRAPRGGGPLDDLPEAALVAAGVLVPAEAAL